MNVTISPSKIHGAVKAPPSKSCTQRACAAALLCGGTTYLTNVGKSNDELAALRVIQQLGATVTHNDDNSITIKSNGIKPCSKQINCGESGLAFRMFASIAALSDEALTLTGTGSLLKRPMHFFEETLPRIGVKVQSNNEMLPLNIQGSLHPTDIAIDGTLSSQFLSGLLFAYSAAQITKPVTISVNNLNSKPYADLTLQVIQHFSLNMPQNDNYDFTFAPLSTHNTQHSTYNIEGDWSNAAFLLVAGAIAGEISVTGLNFDSLQADKAILQVLQSIGCNLIVADDTIQVKSDALNAFEFDATDCPDLFPPLVALAAYCKGTSIIKGAHRLLHKESNRAMALQEEFGKMGVKITVTDNTMKVEGGKGVKSSTVYSHNDHRIAMACAVATLRAQGDVIVENADAVDKSYPDFFVDFLGLCK